MSVVSEGVENDADRVVLVAEGESFTADKKMLMQKCDYFNAMFGGGYKESSQKEIDIQMITAPTLKFILEFLEHDAIQMLDLSTVGDILLGANYFHIDSLRIFIIDRLLSLINRKNCFQILQIAKEHNLGDIELKAKSYVLYHFEDIHDSVGHFPDLKSLFLYLSHSNLNVTNELNVLNFGCEWLKHHPCENGILAVLSCILFKNLNKDSFDALVSNNLIRKNKVALEIVKGISQICNTTSLSDAKDLDSVKKILSSYEDDICEIIFNFLSPQRDRRLAIKPCIVKNTKGVYEVMTFKTNEKRLVKDISLPEIPWWGFSVVSWKDFSVLILCGKLRDKNIWNHEIQIYNCLNKKWSVLPSFTFTPRRHATVIVYGDNIYIIGGFGQYRIILSSVQTYNIKTGEWTDLPDFPELSTCMVAAFHKDELFVSGDHLYVLKDNNWQILFRMPARHSAIISYHNRLYFTEKWRYRLSYWDDVDVMNRVQIIPHEVKLCHFNVVGMSVIGNTAYIFSEGEEFENSISVETCCLELEKELSSTDISWIDENSDGKYYTVSGSFTLAEFDIEDIEINKYGERWLV